MNKRAFLICLVVFLIIFPLITDCHTSDQDSATSTSGSGGNWWDQFGKPEYGGTLIIRATNLQGGNFDPGEFMGRTDLIWFERLFGYDWAVDRKTQSFTTSFVPEEYYQGVLAEGWEHTDPLTITVKIRKEAHWQNKEPLNGRSVTANDVQYTFDRYLGTGSGFTRPHPVFSHMLSLIERVVATDEYTVQFKLKKANALAIYQLLEVTGGVGNIVAPELVEQGLLKDWKDAVGTGAWIPTDFVQDVSLTCSKNDDYWGYDELHPENQLPYLDKVKFINIQDMSTAIAALRSAQIDMIIHMRDGLTSQQAVSISKSNPDMGFAWWNNPGCSVAFRCDTAPFTDIRVRKALQMAVDRPAIGESHYLGTVEGVPAGLVSPKYTGWSIPYKDWPEELQEEYSYNPEKAKQLLAEAAGDGVFAPNQYGGFDTNCVAASSDDITLLEIIKYEFMEVGVDMEISVMDTGAFKKFTMAGKQDQMTFTNTCGMPMRPDMSLARCYSDNRENYTFNSDSKYDDLYIQLTNATDINEAKRIAVEAQRYALEQHWTLMICPYDTPVVWQPWVKGYSGEQIMLGGAAAGNYLAHLWIDQALKESFPD